MLNVMRKLMALLDARERRRFWTLLALVIAMGVANMIGIAAIIPFLSILADPGLIETNAWLSTAYAIMGFTDKQSFMFALGGGVFAVYMGAIMLRAGTAYALFRFGAMRNCSIAMRMLRGYLGQPYTWFLHRHSADLVKTVLTEVGQVTSGVIMPLLNVLANGAVVLSLLILLIAVNPLAALIMTTVMAGGYALVFAVVRSRMRRVGRLRYTANQQRFRVATDSLSGIKEIKVLGLEASAMRRFQKPAVNFAEAVATEGIIGEVPRHFLEGIAFGGMMAVLLMLLALNDGGLAAVLPVAGVYALAGARLTPSMQVVYRGLNAIRFNIPALNALHGDFLDAQSQTEEAPTDFPRMTQSLELRDIRYAYPKAEKTALQGLSFEVRANTTIGIVGGTGAGKTTAMDIILGLLAPDEGMLLVDGEEVTGDGARRGWRRRLGYVPQQIFLTDDTIAANIAFGQTVGEIDRARVEAAARMAELHDFVMQELPDGYDTIAGERGMRLSGGQRQRVGIARALYHDPDVLILDEATSALDNITERAVMASVAALDGAKTIVMVAHRLSTVRNCDEIFLLEDGRLGARGTYDELLERSAVFREMARDVT